MYEYTNHIIIDDKSYLIIEDYNIESEVLPQYADIQVDYPAFEDHLFAVFGRVLQVDASAVNSIPCTIIRLAQNANLDEVWVLKYDFTVDNIVCNDLIRVCGTFDSSNCYTNPNGEIICQPTLKNIVDTTFVDNVLPVVKEITHTNNTKAKWGL